MIMKEEEENIFKLCKMGDINLLRTFLKEIHSEGLIDVVNDIDMDMEEMTPLMYASAGGYTEAVEELILCGAEVSSVINTLGPTYNEHFNAWKSARCSWVLVVTELFNIAVNEMVTAQH